jgi:hypothetical protein
MAQIADLPVLAGSPRQITWAAQLREKMVAEMVRYVNRSLTKPAPGQEAAFAQRYETLADLIRAKTDANWWIDNRMDAGVTLVKRFVSGR